MTPLEIYKILPQTNCRKCLLPSCLAFAAAVVSGQKSLQQCPDINPGYVQQFGHELGTGREDDSASRQEMVQQLRQQLVGCDFAALAHQRGGRLQDDQLALTSLGKDFFVDSRGTLSSQCHIIPWVELPLLTYLVQEEHQPVTGQWLSFREIDDGLDWQGLFRSRCETPLKELADGNSSLLHDLIDLFQGQQTSWYEADIALILHPLPHIPLLICYQAAEDDLGSHLTILFDSCCRVNLPIRALYSLTAGLVQMFAKIAEQHGL